MKNMERIGEIVARMRLMEGRKDIQKTKMDIKWSAADWFAGGFKILRREHRLSPETPAGRIETIARRLVREAQREGVKLDPEDVGDMLRQVAVGIEPKHSFPG